MSKNLNLRKGQRVGENRVPNSKHRFLGKGNFCKPYPLMTTLGQDGAANELPLYVINNQMYTKRH